MLGEEKAKIYTEYDAERRAQEIAGEMLRGCISRLEELEQNTLALMNYNETLREKLKKSQDVNTQHIQAIIYYDETFNRLPEEDKKRFKEIGKGVINDYNLPFEKDEEKKKPKA